MRLVSLGLGKSTLEDNISTGCRDKRGSGKSLTVETLGSMRDVRNAQVATQKKNKEGDVCPGHWAGASEENFEESKARVHRVNSNVIPT